MQNVFDSLSNLIETKVFSCLVIDKNAHTLILMSVRVFFCQNTLRLARILLGWSCWWNMKMSSSISGWSPWPVSSQRDKSTSWPSPPPPGLFRLVTSKYFPDTILVTISHQVQVQVSKIKDHLLSRPVWCSLTRLHLMPSYFPMVRH